MSRHSTNMARIRPNLSEVSPLVYFISWGYGIVNLLIGVGLISFFKTSVPLVVANILTYQMWGIVFFLMGLAMIYALIRNQWDLLRAMNLIGLGIKATWAIALLIRCFVAPQTIIVTLVWIFLTHVQAGLVIHFLPPMSSLEEVEPSSERK